MKHILNAFYTRPLVIYLVLAIIAISSAAGPAEAMLLPAVPDTAGSSAPDRAADIAKVQKTLESRELRQKLLDYGLTPEETEARISSLSDEQLHRLAANLDAVQAGGDALSTLVFVVLVALLVVLIIYLMEGRIEIKKR